MLQLPTIPTLPDRVSGTVALSRPTDLDGLVAHRARDTNLAILSRSQQIRCRTPQRWLMLGGGALAPCSRPVCWRFITPNNGQHASDAAVLTKASFVTGPDWRLLDLSKALRAKDGKPGTALFHDRVTCCDLP